MKNVLLSIILTTLSLTYFGQSELSKLDKKELKTANADLANGDFITAYNVYLPLYKKHPENSQVLYGVGVCKLNRRGEEKDALRLLIQSFRNGDKNPDILFHLGRAYHLHHKLDEAISAFEDYKSLRKRSIDLITVDRNIKMAFNAKKMIEDARNVDIINLGAIINTSSQESVPVILPNGKGIFFTSRRAGGFSGEKDHQGNYWQDIYYAEYFNRKWQSPENAEPFNTKLHDGSVSISHDGSTFISYTTTEKSSNGHPEYSGDLYFSNFIDSSWWTPPKAYGPSINSEFQELSACLSLDKNTLYFSSNRPGGYGGFDLYKVQKLPSGKWGTAINMGPNVNTEYNEDAPFMHADGVTLYFSSEGHSTMGGFDIFKTYLKYNKVWSTPENLGYPINTVENDIYFSLSRDGRTGYYSSNKIGGLGGQDIYQIKMLDAENYQSVVRCYVVDKTGKTPVDAKITLIDNFNHQLTGVYQTNSDKGDFIMAILPEVEYQVVIEATGYSSRVIHMSFTDEEESMSHQFKLVKKPIKR